VFFDMVAYVPSENGDLRVRTGFKHDIQLRYAD